MQRNLNKEQRYCINCGNNGHLVKDCREPVISIGIICIKCKDINLKNELIKKSNEPVLQNSPFVLQEFHDDDNDDDTDDDTKITIETNEMSTQTESIEIPKKSTKKEEKKSKENKENKEKNLTNFQRFTSIHLNHLKNKVKISNPNLRMKINAEIWKTLSEDDKNKYRNDSYLYTISDEEIKRICCMNIPQEQIEFLG